MKNIILLIACVMATTLTFAEKPYSFGVTAGYNYSGVLSSSGTKYVSGYYAGAVAEYQLNQFLSMRTELTYSRQGYDWDGGEIFGNSSSKMSYLNLPMLTKVHLFDFMSLDLGPQLGFPLKAERVSDFGDEIAETTIKTNPIVISFPVGVSFNVIEKMDIYARYVVGLSNMEKEVKSKMSVIEIGAAYRF